MKFKIGTRKSLLAKTQCTQVKEQLEMLSPNSFELSFFTTEGDQKLDKALWQLEGKDFFTKELDIALLNSNVDINVHSYKDLGSDRPEGIIIGAIPKRQISNDICFISNKNVEKLIAGQFKTFIVGTSSPRRQVNIEKCLQNFLPNNNSLEIKTKILRGNVNTRIEKLMKGDYDAIVLAYAGVERLASSKSSNQVLKDLLQDTNFIILPQTVFPSAASQGALAIEKKQTNKNQVLDKVLNDIHDSHTYNAIKIEREIFNQYGGGCHLALGIHVREVAGGMVIIKKGIVDSLEINQVIYQNDDNLSLPKLTPKQMFIGLDQSQLQKYNRVRENSNIVQENFVDDRIIEKEIFTEKYHFENENLLISSKHALKAIDSVKNSIVFCSGTKLWKELNSKGIFVNACGDLEGETELLSYKNSNLMKLYLKNNNFLVLTNDSATSSLGETKPAYKRVVKDMSKDLLYREKLQQVQAFFWTSFFEYQTFVSKYNFIEDKIQCCGIGKTYQQFSKQKIKVHPFLNIDNFISTFKKI